MSAKGHEAKRRRLQELRQAANPPPPSPTDGYISQRLFRVRVQLDLVDAQIKAEATKSSPDGQVLNWLCAAQERLSEQERILADRPLPGSRRPTAIKGKVKAGSVEPSEPIPYQEPAMPQPAPSPAQDEYSAPKPLGWEYDL